MHLSCLSLSCIEESSLSAPRPWASLHWSHPEVGPERTNFSDKGPLCLVPCCLALGIRTWSLVIPSLGLSPESWCSTTTVGAGVLRARRDESHKLDSPGAGLCDRHVSTDVCLSTNHAFLHVICQFAFESWDKSGPFSRLDHQYLEHLLNGFLCHSSHH